jgi:crotonobetainyl-CoA:carnitine CoA-transferase CaiB-like acyl-CoA transferase
MSNARPLDGIRVFDWTIFGVGPFASTMLGALGADVIKIESPGRDPQLRSESFQRGMSTMYINQNLCKRSIQLDLAADEGRAQAFELLKTCDVFLNNMREGTPEKLGLSYERVAAVSPRIIYCIATGWGNRGPMAQLGNVDILAQAFSGMASITGSPNGPPEFYRQLGNLDYTTSNVIAAAILEALYARERTGEGRRLDLSLLEAAVAVQGTRLAEFLATETIIPRLGAANTARAPDQAFQSGDLRYFALSVETDAQWQRLCDALERPDLRGDERLCTNRGRVEHREELASELTRIFGTAPFEWWDLQLTRHRIPHAPFCDFTALKDNSQVRENRLLVKVPTRWGEIFSGAAPWSLSEETITLWTSPIPGGDTDEVLASVADQNSRSSRRPHTAAAQTSSARTALPLEGLRVLDLTGGLAGPHCAQLLAAGGAVVVKLEPPAGDPTLAWLPAAADGQASVYLTLNHDKLVWRASTEAEYRRLAKRWAGVADVCLTDYVDSDGRKPPVSYSMATKGNPKLVYCSISGFGERGPLASVPASELPVQAIAAVAWGFGRPGGSPIRIGADIAALNAGVNAFQGIVASLYVRLRTGRGQRVAVSLLGSLLFVKSFHWGAFTAPDTWSTSLIHRSWTRPPVHGYRTLDGRVYFVWYRGDKEEFQSLLDDLDLGHLGHTDPRFQDGPGPSSGFGKYGDECVPIYEAAFASRTTAQVIEILNRHAAYAVPVLDHAQLVAHPQIEALQMLAPINIEGGRLRVLRRPWQFEGSDFTPEPPKVVSGGDSSMILDPWHGSVS